jgi:hypothetical protein
LTYAIAYSLYTHLSVSHHILTTGCFTVPDTNVHWSVTTLLSLLVVAFTRAWKPDLTGVDCKKLLVFRAHLLKLKRIEQETN